MAKDQYRGTISRALKLVTGDDVADGSERYVEPAARRLGGQRAGGGSAGGVSTHHPDYGIDLCEPSRAPARIGGRRTLKQGVISK
jgi:hypothetical protein